MTDSDFSDKMGSKKYDRFCTLFDAAERRIKQFEKLDFEPCIPAINQLRYAACHLKRSFQAADPKDEADCISSAERHCQRAIKDVAEAAVDYCVVWVSCFERAFAFVPISDEVREHNQIRTELRDAANFLASYSHDGIEGATERLENCMDIALKAVNRYEAARPELNKRARLMRWKIICGAIGILLALIGLLVKLLL